MAIDGYFMLAFWRRSACCGIEILVPHKGYSAMRYAVIENPAYAARRIARGHFDVDPRSNARIFRQFGDPIVAFSVNATEAAALSTHGQWLPPVFIMDPQIAPLLHELATYL